MSQVTSYIQGHDANTLASHKSRSAAAQADYLIPHVQSTDRILDVGCGPGTITCDFASLASKGHVIGVDYSDHVIEQARSEAKTRGLANVDFQTGTAHELPFNDDTFDVVHCHAVLVHLPRAAAAIKEMRRVCKPGGYVAAREPDWDTTVMHPHDPRLERWLEVYTKLKSSEGAEIRTGRHLAQWAAEAGFEPSKIQLSCNVLQYSGTEQVRWWGELYAKRMKTEMGQRALETGAATQSDVDGFVAAYEEWSQKGDQGALWALTHMRLLCQK